MTALVPRLVGYAVANRAGAMKSAELGSDGIPTIAELEAASVVPSPAGGTKASAAELFRQDLPNVDVATNARSSRQAPPGWDCANARRQSHDPEAGRPGGPAIGDRRSITFDKEC